MPQINVQARQICIALFLFTIYLLFQSITFRFLDDLYSPNSPFILDKLARVFNSNVEESIPTYFSILLLTSSSVLLALITYSKYLLKERYHFHWGLLAAIFLYLATDESAEIHEMLTRPIRDALDLSGRLYFSWVVAGAVFVVIVGLIYLRFLWYLPRLTAILMILSAAIYVSGAIVIESFSANIYDLNDGSSFTYTVVGNFEEFLEMSGIILFIYTLLAYLRNTVPNFQINFRAGTASELQEDIPAQ
jgi:hypothetical protein